MGAALDLTLLSLSTSRPTSDPELDGGQISTEPPTANETISGIKDQVFAKIERSVRRNLSTSGDEMQIRADIGLAFRELYEFEVDIDGLTRQAADVMRTRAAGEIKDKELDLMRGAITDEEAGKDLKRSLGFLSMAHMCDGREEEVCIEYLATLDDATLKKLGKREHRRRNYESEDVIRALLESETERFLSSYDTNDKFEYFSGLTFNVQLKLALKAERRLNLPKAIALRRMILERDDIDPLKDKLESYTHLLNDLKLSGNIVEAREVAEEFWAYLVDLPDTEAKFSREADVVGRMINVFDDLCRFEDELDNDLDDEGRAERASILKDFLAENLNDKELALCYRLLISNIEDPSTLIGSLEALDYCQKVLKLEGLSDKQKKPWEKREGRFFVKLIVARAGDGFETESLIMHADIARQNRMKSERRYILELAKTRGDITSNPRYAYEVLDALIRVNVDDNDHETAAKLANELYDLQVYGLATGNSASTISRIAKLERIDQTKTMELEDSLRDYFLTLLTNYFRGGLPGFKGPVVDGTARRIGNRSMKRSIIAALQGILNASDKNLPSELENELSVFKNNLKKLRKIDRINLERIIELLTH